MRSRAELAARALALLLVLWLLARAVRPGGGPATATSSAALGGDLVRWSTALAPQRVAVNLNGPISPVERDWLAALAGAGAAVTWRGSGALPLAAVALPVADPQRASRVWVAAPAGAVVTLSDAFGPLDSLRLGAGGGGFLVRSAPQTVRVRAGALAAAAQVRDSLVLGRLLLLGRAGWESKFVAAALEERGWKVDERFALSPKGDVSQGVATPLDTARYSAVIVLDSIGAPDIGRVTGYVRSGGGAVLAARAGLLPALRDLAAGALQHADSALEPFDTAAADPRRSLALTPIAVRGDAVPLELRRGKVAVAARRVGRGRALVVGYDDTWRWRMAGGGDAAESFRDWWTGLVAAVAYTGASARALTGPLDEAPYAHLVDRLGPAARSAPAARVVPSWWLFAATLALLLAEWASRRLRGAA